MKRRETLKVIDKMTKEGLSKKEIFAELKGQIRSRNDLLQLLAMVPSSEMKSKYQNLNKILLLLLILVAGFRIALALYFAVNTSLLLIPYLLFAVFVAGYFVMMVWNFRGSIYRILGLFGIAGLMKSVSNFEEWSSYTSTDILSDLLLNYIPVSLIVILSFYIGNKVFPYYGFWGMLQEKKLDI